MTDSLDPYVEKVITGHARLAWDTSGDDDNVSARQSCLQLLIAHIAL